MGVCGWKKLSKRKREGGEVSPEKRRKREGGEVSPVRRKR